MADGEVLALLAHIRDIGERTEKKLDGHVERDERINKEFILPMWNAYQQQKGVARLAGIIYTLIGGGLVAAIDYWAKTGGHGP